MKKKKARLKVYPRILKLDFNTFSLWRLYIYIQTAILTNCYLVFILLILSLLDLVLATHFFTAFYALAFILLSIAIEESFHVISAIALNRQTAIIGITIRTLRIFGCPVLCCGAAVRFTKSQLNGMEHALIAFGGPFCSLVCSCFFLTIISLTVQVNTLIVFSLLVTPIFSLLPSRYKSFISDGYVVLSEIKRSRTIMPFFRFIKQIIHSAINM